MNKKGFGTKTIGIHNYETSDFIHTFIHLAMDIQPLLYIFKTLAGFRGP